VHLKTSLNSKQSSSSVQVLVLLHSLRKCHLSLEISQYLISV
jgi:hypothetical protein